MELAQLGAPAVAAAAGGSSDAADQAALAKEATAKSLLITLRKLQVRAWQ